MLYTFKMVYKSFYEFIEYCYIVITRVDKVLIIRFKEASIAMNMDHKELGESFKIFLQRSFPKRYLPDYYLSNSGEYDARIHWLKSNSFRVLKTIFTNNIDEYVVETPQPEVYVNESPVFFLLQVLSRILVKKKIYLFSDSVTVFSRDRTILFLGYPHSGKSTLTALSLHYGDIPLSTENTMLEISSDCIRVIGGSSILVYDPRIEELYDVKIPYTEVTKHGYRVIDLNEIAKDRVKILENKPCIDEVYLIHCMFNAIDVSIEEIKGRKIGKTIWFFATMILNGIDYYEPYPLTLLDNQARSSIYEMIKFFIRKYNGRFYEIYGKHDKVYEYVRSKR